MSTGALTPAWRDRVAEAVHTGVSAVTPAARATGACLRYACVGAEILRSELPVLGIAVASATIAVGSLFLRSCPDGDRWWAWDAGDVERGAFHAVAVARTSAGLMVVDFAARHYPAWLAVSGDVWSQASPCPASVWTIDGWSPDWWLFRPDRARTAHLLGILATRHNERAAIERAAGIARRVLAGGTE